jgi:hypothetical protein
MFKNAYHALGWAYTNINRPLVKMSAINHMRGGYGTENMLLYDLSAEDRKKQAAMIIGMVSRLPDLAEREYIEARFGRRVSHDEINVLIYRGCAALGLGLDKTNSVCRVMQSYFSGSMSSRAVRREFGCRHAHAVMIKSCLYDVLDVIHDRAIADMTEAFERVGLIAVHRENPVDHLPPNIKELIRLLS